MDKWRRHIHPEIINIHLGPHLLCMRVIELRGNPPGPSSPGAPVPPKKVPSLDLKRQADLPHVTW